MTVTVLSRGQAAETPDGIYGLISTSLPILRRVSVYSQLGKAYRIFGMYQDELADIIAQSGDEG